MNWSWPLGSRVPNRLYAIGRREFGELVRFDPATGGFQHYLKGIPATQVDFSRDGRLIAYSRYSDHTLWVAKADGTN
jgi:hypothetical protein